MPEDRDSAAPPAVFVGTREQVREVRRALREYGLDLVRMPGAEAHAVQRLSGVTVGGDHGLSPRERQVADLLAEGLTDKEIAARLGVAAGTVRGLVKRIFLKLRVNKRSAIARRLPE